MPVRPYTLAVRVVHSGRYGGDAGDFRLRDAYVGSPALVRGYGATDARVRLRRGARLSRAPDALLASRVVVAKLEPPGAALECGDRAARCVTACPSRRIRVRRRGRRVGGEQRFGPGGSDNRFVRSAGLGRPRERVH